MADELGERTEQPTGRRLIEARRKGQVARSQNLSAFVGVAGGVLLLYIFGGRLLEGLMIATRRALEPERLGSELDLDSVLPILSQSAVNAAMLAAPILLIMTLVVVVEQIYQVGWHISAEPLQPKFSRFNPVNGVKKLFSRRTLVKTAVDIVKLALILTVAVAVLRAAWDRVVALSVLPVMAAFREALAILLEITLWALVVLLVIGLFDRVYQKWQHTQDLKMTKQQVKEERKSVEGDPQIKARRMRMARDMVRQNVRSSVPQADVVVTNPTHYSVAIKYDAATMNAPRVVAKGVDHLAIHIRLIAAAHGVPIVERPPLARALYWGVEVGREVPAEQFEAVAELLAYVYRLEGRMAS